MWGACCCCMWGCQGAEVQRLSADPNMKAAGAAPAAGRFIGNVLLCLGESRGWTAKHLPLSLRDR